MTVRLRATPASLSQFVVRYAVEARRAGRLPEAMIVDLKQLYRDALRAQGAAELWSASRPSSDDALSQIVSIAIRAYFAEGAAA